MKKLALAVFAAFISLAPIGAAMAQSAASQDVIGYWTTSGCPGGNTPCFVQYGSSIPTTSTAASSTFVSSSALVANQVISAAAAKLVSFNVSADSTLSGAAWWIMIYNATSAPADGAVTPTKCYSVPSGTTSVSGAFTAPPSYSTGIVIGVSTTGCFTKTASTHAFISADYQ